jgi:hypothetical protein
MSNTKKPVAIIGIVSMIAGLVLIIAGGAVWGMITGQLKDENITISADADMLAGKKVGGPFTAYAQAGVINKHALAGSGGLTYAELGDKAKELEKAGATEEEVAEVKAQRTSVMNGSFLRASLFTSVVAYGVSALVMGLGLMFILVGYSLKILASAPAAAAPAAARETVNA